MGLLSVPHLIVIFIVALVVFGPEKLPELARALGKGLAEFRRATGELRMNFEDHLRELERETQHSQQHALEAPRPPEGTVGAGPVGPSSVSASPEGSKDSEKPADGRS